MENKYLSRLPGFYRHSLAKRQEILVAQMGVKPTQMQAYVPQNGLSLGRADKMVENCLGVFGLPLGIALNFIVDDEPVVVPMCVEEPSVIAASSNTAKLVAKSGGFKTAVDEPNMIGQIQLVNIRDVDKAVLQIEQNRLRLIKLANTFCIDMVKRGGGVRDLNVRKLAPISGEFSEFDNQDPMLVVEFVLDCCDAMGANIVNKVAEDLAAKIAQLTSTDFGLQILSNLSDKRLAKASCSIPIKFLANNITFDNGHQIAKKIMDAFCFALRDPYRAATHNKGVLNGIDAVAIATGNDWRAIEAGAHAYAAKNGAYTSLTQYILSESGEELECYITLPLAVGVVGGSINTHPVVRTNLNLLGSFGKCAKKLAALMAAVGLAQNLGALRAMCSHGIQKGHMKLHARKAEQSN